MPKKSQTRKLCEKDARKSLKEGMKGRSITRKMKNYVANIAGKIYFTKKERRERNNKKGVMKMLVDECMKSPVHKAPKLILK
jgi:hypothetical protein